MKRNLKQREQIVQKEKFVRQVFPQLQPKNENQRLLLDAFKYDRLVVAQGSAGTGKSILSVWHAAKQLQAKQIKKVILITLMEPIG